MVYGIYTCCCVCILTLSHINTTEYLLKGPVCYIYISASVHGDCKLSGLVQNLSHCIPNLAICSKVVTSEMFIQLKVAHTQ